jgi:uncharacterized protein YyaL (SSP411 family)
MTAGAREASRLVAERSPFLQHGATQPVDWWPWGEAAFQRARELDRPLLLDIGAVWCHWCHVMDSESYEDADTAALINQFFIPVKVDRDERPDVDARYQRAVQVLSGQGGWPLTAFLTPAGDVFFGGTYFPPDERFGRPSFRRVLREVARIWTEERSRALSSVRNIDERLASYTQGEQQPGEPSEELIGATIEELARDFDFRWGGFGRAPKFPHAGGVDLMLDHWFEQGDEWAARIVRETLHAMGSGGIFDQLGGGFHRYATDVRWIIPHFEKMAYDNGPLLATYAGVAAAMNDGFCAAIADGIVTHYLDVAPDLVAAGGFPASQDADFGHDNDGDYWTWTEAELRRALGDGLEYRVARLRYGLDDPGGAMHQDRQRHVLFRALDDETLARTLELPLQETRAALERVRTTLKAARDLRPAPFVDRTLYTGWSALVASGHLAAWRWLDRPAAGAAGLRALERIWSDAFRARLGVMHRVADADSGEALEDQAFAMLGCLDAFEITQQGVWLDRTRLLADVLAARFRDPGSGAFRDRPLDAEAVVPAMERPHLPIADAPTPSGNGAAALALLRLAAVTGGAAYQAAGTAVLRAFAGSAARLLGSAATWMKALAWATQPVTTVMVVDAAPPAASELLGAALRTWRPRTLVRWLRPGDDVPAGLPLELQALLTGAHPRAYVCAGHVCAAPVARPAELADLLRGLRG